MTSYQVKFWDVKKIGDTAKGRWRVRWAVAGREHCRSFAAKPLADSHRGRPCGRLPALPGGERAVQRYSLPRGLDELCPLHGYRKCNLAGGLLVVGLPDRGPDCTSDLLSARLARHRR